jgi:hypothetical protein
MRFSILTFIFVSATTGWTQPLFSGPIIITDAGASDDLIVVDMNEDGLNDVILSTSRIAVNRWDEVTTFGLLPTQISLGSLDIDVGDIDGQNGKDLVWDGSGIFIGFNQSLTTPTFAQVRIWDRPQQSGVAIGDLNNDGALDIVATGSTGPFTFTHWVAVFENQETSPSSFIRHDLSDSEFSQRYCAVADLNNDGKPDIITTSDVVLAWRENLTTETMNFRKDIITSSTLPTYYFQKPVPVDFDGDGDMDILVNTKAEVLWLENLDATSPTFVRHEIYLDLTGDPAQPFMDYNIRRCKPLDFDLDGDMDVVVTGRNLLVLENVGDNLTFVPRPISTPADDGLTIAVDVGDLNDDGFPDLVVSFLQPSTAIGLVVLYLNRFSVGSALAAEWTLYH